LAATYGIGKELKKYPETELVDVEDGKQHVASDTSRQVADRCH